MNILIVDDDPVALKILETILLKYSHKVEQAASVKEAKIVLKKYPNMDLIISDIMMPIQDGFDLLNYLKSDRLLKRIPVILCTALGNFESVQKALKLNVIGYVLKPIDAKILIEKVKYAEKQQFKTIMIVDDEELIRTILTKTFERDGWHVVTAANGQGAVNLLKDNQPTLVVSDIAMPEMDGFKLLLIIKEMYPNLPVVLISGQGEWRRDQIIAAGADEFISKPFKNTDILTSIDSVLERRAHANINRRG